MNHMYALDCSHAEYDLMPVPWWSSAPNGSAANHCRRRESASARLLFKASCGFTCSNSHWLPSLVLHDKLLACSFSSCSPKRKLAAAPQVQDAWRECRRCHWLSFWRIRCAAVTPICSLSPAAESPTRYAACFACLKQAGVSRAKLSSTIEVTPRMLHQTSWSEW